VKVLSRRKIEITEIANFLVKLCLELKSMNFRSQKLASTHTRCIESSNSDHSRTAFPFTTSYFLTHYIKTCMHDLVSPNLEKEKVMLQTLVENMFHLG